MTLMCLEIITLLVSLESLTVGNLKTSSSYDSYFHSCLENCFKYSLLRIFLPLFTLFMCYNDHLKISFHSELVSPLTGIISAMS